MSIFNVLALLGGLAMFLYGMSLMGEALERRAGNQLKSLLSKLTANPMRGFLLGLIVTTVIQSSSATTVMVVGFVNSGLMKLAQSVYIIMGANVGTAITAWVLSLTGIQGDAWYITILKPSSFTPILALIGIGIYMFTKKKKSKDTASILLGFAILMFGMEAMSDAVEPLADMPGFAEMFTMFSNPILGVLVGAGLTAILQSSSASVGILQALSLTGTVSYGSAIPIIMGQNIGTCITAVLASAGASRDAKRTSVIHLLFNVVGTIVWLIVFYVLNAIFNFAFVDFHADPLGIAIVHTAFKIFSTVLLMPFGQKLVQLAQILVPDRKEKGGRELLDERLFVTPPVAIEQARNAVITMAEMARDAFCRAVDLLDHYDPAAAEVVDELESKVDMYEDNIGTYLVHLSALNISEADSREVTEMLHIIGDFERISDHATNVMQSAQELHDKQLQFSPKARNELKVITSAVRDALNKAVNAYVSDDLEDAMHIEPLEQIVDKLRDEIRARHIARLTRGECTIEMGFVLTDMLTNLERVSDHCSNIGLCVVETHHKSFDMHRYGEEVRNTPDVDYSQHIEKYTSKYALPKE